MNNVTDILYDAFSRGYASHAYIVVAEGSQLPSLLRKCAEIALCPSHADDNCAVCRKVKSGAHQDVVVIPADGAKKRVTVEDVNYLVEESVKRPVDNGNVRVFLLDASQSVTGNASVWQNKLLKTLEEPLEGVYIFIGVSDAEALLPTVRSRCQTLKLRKLSALEVKDKLRQNGVAEGSAEKAAAMCGGNLESAEKLLANPAVFKAYDNATAMLTEMLSTKTSLKYVAPVVAERGTVADFLGFLTLLLRESIAYRVQPSLCLLPSMEESIKQICSNYSLQAAEVCIEVINAAKRRLDDNGNLSVVLDNLAANMMEVKYRCRI